MCADRIVAVLFDADGVVQRPAPQWRSELAGLCADAARVDEFLADVFAAEKPCLTGAAEFPAALAEVLRRWQSPVGVETALGIWTLIEPNEPILQIADGLRERHVTVGLATNQQATRSRFMSEALGYRNRFDHEFYSHQLGAAKPGTDFFARIVERLELPLSAVLFFDDHDANVAAAREAGLQAEVYDLRSGPEAMHALLAQHGLAVR